MNKEKLAKNILDQAKIFKSRAVKSFADDKRHDLVQQDERKSMWTAHNRLGWSFSKIGSAFERDWRTAKKVVESHNAKLDQRRRRNPIKMLREEAYSKCEKGDHSWFDNSRLEGLAYRRESSHHEHDDFGGIRTDSSTKTCYFCGYVQTELSL